MVDGRWQMVDGRWRMADGRDATTPPDFQFSIFNLHFAFFNLPFAFSIFHFAFPPRYGRAASFPQSLKSSQSPVSSNEPTPTWPQANVLSLAVMCGFCMSSK